MQVFIISLVNSHGQVHMLYACVKEEDVEKLREKIPREFRVRGKYKKEYDKYISPGLEFAKAALEDLRKITGYNFEPLLPDIKMHLHESIHLPGSVCSDKTKAHPDWG